MRLDPEVLRARERQRMTAIRRQRRGAGLCGCGRPPRPGRKMCEVCYARQVQRKPPPLDPLPRQVVAHVRVSWPVLPERLAELVAFSDRHRMTLDTLFDEALDAYMELTDLQEAC